MHKELIVSSTSLETRLAILEDDQVTALLIERSKNKGCLHAGQDLRDLTFVNVSQNAFVDPALSGREHSPSHHGR